MKDGKNRVRAEHQEYADAIVKKLFPDGHLVESDEGGREQKDDSNVRRI